MASGRALAGRLAPFKCKALSGNRQGPTLSLRKLTSIWRYQRNAKHTLTLFACANIQRSSAVCLACDHSHFTIYCRGLTVRRTIICFRKTSHSR